MKEDFRAGHLKLIALAAHILNEDGQVQFAPAAYFKGVGCFAVVDTQADIRFNFPVQARPQVTGGDIGALTAGKGAVVD